MAASRSALGERWLDVYLTSPAWRFVCAAGHLRAGAGPRPDGAERRPRRPLLPADPGRRAARRTSAWSPRRPTARRSSTAPSGWSSRRSRPTTSTSRSSTSASSAWRDELLPLTSQPQRGARSGRGVDSERGRRRRRGRCRSDRPSDLAPVFEQLLSHRLSAIYDPLVLWWTEGSSIVEPSCLIAKGLPHPDAFAALLDGSWAQHRWRSIAGAGRPDDAMPEDTLVDDTAAIGFRSAAATDVGRAQRQQSGRLPRADRDRALGGGRRARRAQRRRSGEPDGLRRACRLRAGRELRDHDRDGARADPRGERASARSSTRAAVTGPERQHRRGPAGARPALRDPLGRRQPRLPLAHGPAGTADPRSQPGANRARLPVETTRTS